MLLSSLRTNPPNECMNLRASTLGCTRRICSGIQAPDRPAGPVCTSAAAVGILSSQLFKQNLRTPPLTCVSLCVWHMHGVGTGQGRGCGPKFRFVCAAADRAFVLWVPCMQKWRVRACGGVSCKGRKGRVDGCMCWEGGGCPADLQAYVLTHCCLLLFVCNAAHATAHTSLPATRWHCCMGARLPVWHDDLRLIRCSPNKPTRMALCALPACQFGMLSCYIHTHVC